MPITEPRTPDAGDAPDEPRVPRNFWRKLRRVASRLPFLDELLAAYYCALDPATPRRVKGILVSALVYFVVPTDLLPDVLAHIGFTDDAAVLFAAINAVSPHIRDRHREQAQAALDRLGQGGA